MPAAIASSVTGRRPFVALVGLAALVAFAAPGCAGEGEAPPEGGVADTTATADDAAAGSPVAGPEVLDVAWRATGTEPFWGVDVTGDGMVLRRPAEPNVAFGAPEVRRTGDTLRFLAAGEAGVGLLGVDVVPGPCSDGMSDREYEYRSRVKWREERFAGCAVRDPLPTDSAVLAAGAPAGLTEALAVARRTQATSGRFVRVEGSLGRRRGAEATFVARFDGDAPVVIDLTIVRDGAPLFETSYFFESSGSAGDVTLRLVESDAWVPEAAGHTSTLIGFEADGSALGGLHAIDEEPLELPSGVVEAERSSARDLVREARAARRNVPSPSTSQT